MHSFRDFRALRVDTDQVTSAELIGNSHFDTSEMVREDQSGYYLYEMAKWRDSGPGLRIVGVFGILELHNSPTHGHHQELLDVSIATSEEDISDHILAHEQVLGDISTASHIAPSLMRDGSGPIWAIADTDVIDMVAPNKIGPIARATDSDHVAHRLYALPQPALIRVIKAAIEECELVLADGHHRVRAAMDYLSAQPPGAKVELLCFICQAKDVSGIIRPIHRVFSGPSSLEILDRLTQELETSTIRPETPHVELVSGAPSIFVPVTKTISGTISRIEEFFVANPGIEIEYFSAPEALNDRIAEGAAVGLLCPSIPVAEIIYSAKKRQPLKPKSTLFFPKPIPAMILGEDEMAD